MNRLFALLATAILACAGCSQEINGSAQPDEDTAAVLGVECFDIHDDAGIQDRGVTKSDLGSNMAVITSIKFGCLPDGVAANITFAATSDNIAYGFAASEALTRDYPAVVVSSKDTFSTNWIQFVSKEALAKHDSLTINFWVEAVPAVGSQPYDERTVVISPKR